MSGKKILFSCFLLLSTLTSCELIDLINNESMKGTWKIHYRYEGEKEVLMPVTFSSDHSFSYPVDEDKGGGVWTLNDNTLELEFSERMIWKGKLNDAKDEIKKGVMINSGYGNGGGTWDGKKID